MVLKGFVSSVFSSVHCERLQSLSNKCSMDPDKVKYIYIYIYISITYAFVGSKRLTMFVPYILDRLHFHVCCHVF